MFGLVHATMYLIPLRIFAYGDSTLSELGVAVEDSVGVLVLSEITRGVDTPLHVDMLYI